VSAVLHHQNTLTYLLIFLSGC